MIKLKAEPLGPIHSTPKGFIRDFLVVLENGKKAALAVFSKDADKLKGEGVRDMEITPGKMVFAV